MLVQVDRLGNPPATDIPLETVHRRKYPLIPVDPSEIGVCRIVNVSHQHHLGTSPLQPIMVRAIQLDHLPKTRLTLSMLPVFLVFALPLPETLLDQPLSQRLFAD